MNKALSFVAGLFVGAALFLLCNFVWYNVMFQKGLIFVVGKILGLLADVVILIFMTLCWINIIPINTLGWFILSLFATLVFIRSVGDIYEALFKLDQQSRYEYRKSKFAT